uniref:Type I-A CRISPR-associated protein Cas5 n=1 Tax=Ignisphaera aggregans TaxID=334771 RepID=A0A7C5UTE3_9CREN
MSRELYAVFVEVTVFGPIAVYIPYSTTSTNIYLLPPPTTLVGALAYAYKRSLNNFKELDEDGSSQALEIIENGDVLYASAGIDEPYTVSRSIEKVYQHIYLRSEHWKRSEMAYTVGVRPSIITRKLYILYIVANGNIARYSYGITRIGRKESLVAVDNVEIAPLKSVVSKSRYCETGFYFPLSIAQEYSPKDMWIKVDMPILARENFMKKSIKTEKYVVPKPFAFRKASVQLSESGVAIKMKVRDKTMEVPIPRNIIGG